MDDLGTEVALVHFAEDAQARAGLQHFLLAGIEIEEAQRKAPLASRTRAISWRRGR
jgi:hypothetical protein